jgi:hypothetical protein
MNSLSIQSDWFSRESDPFGDIDDLMEDFNVRFSTLPSVAIAGRLAWRRLVEHPDCVQRMEYQTKRTSKRRPEDSYLERLGWVRPPDHDSVQEIHVMEWFGFDEIIINESIPREMFIVC